MTAGTKRLMFVCRKNSSRSQMAEGFAKQLGEGDIVVVSSGVEASQVNPSQVNPIAIEAMASVGVDISRQTCDALQSFDPEQFDIVISLCGCGIELPPDWRSRPIFENWQLEDPAEQPEIFPRVRDEIRGRVKALLVSLKAEGLVLR